MKIDNMKIKFFRFLVTCLAAMTIVSCSDNDEPQTSSSEEEGYFLGDELSTLQSSLAKIDEQGNLVERILGVSLDSADPDNVSVGVENLDQAISIFKSLFADNTNLSEDGLSATFTTRPGSAQLQTAGLSDGSIARATFDVSGLKYVRAVNFILNSAWPENYASESNYKIGDKINEIAVGKYPGYPFPSNMTLDFICIRECKNGLPAILLAITPDAYKLYEDLYDKIPSIKKAMEILEILKNDWEFYKTLFNEATPNLLDESTNYWTNTVNKTFFYQRCSIHLSDGNIGYHNIPITPKLKVLFYLETGTDSQVTVNP